MDKSYRELVTEDADELILAGHALSNAGYFMKKVLREQALAQKCIDKHNEKLFREAGRVKSVNEIEAEIERLKKKLEEAVAKQ